MFIKLRNKLQDNAVLKNIITLFSGTVIAQVIPVLVSPIVARIYTPTEFGELTLFISICTIAGSIAAAKYEMAIALPEKSFESQLVTWVSAKLIFLSLLLSYFVVFLFSDKLSQLLGPSIYFAPASITLLGFANSITYWLGRRRKYLLLSKGKIVQSISNGSLQIAFGYVEKLFNGLIISYLLGQLLFVVIAGRTFFYSLIRFSKYVNLQNLKLTFKRFDRFLIFYTPTALLDNVSMHAPVFILSNYYSMATAGLFGLTYRIINLPLSLISSAVGQVYYQEIASLRNKGQNLKPYVVATAKKLFLLSLLPTAVLLIAGEYLFIFIFGKEWSTSGYFAQVLAIPFAIRFIASPLSSVLIVNNKLKVLSVWQVMYFASTIFVLFLGTRFDLTFFIYIYGLNEVVLYLIYLFLIIKFSK